MCHDSAIFGSRTLHDCQMIPLQTGMLSRMDGRGYFYIEKHLESHAWAMNHLLDEIFRRDYDVAFNVNIDDYYAPTRFAEQIAKVCLLQSRTYNSYG